MTPVSFKEARCELRLSFSGMADALGITGTHRGRTIRCWEAGERDIPTTVDALVSQLLGDWRHAQKIVAHALVRFDEADAEYGAPRVMSLLYYPDAEALAAFKRDDLQMTWGLHQTITRATVAAFHDRDIVSELIPMRVEEYGAWLGARPSTSENRACYATETSRRQRLRISSLTIRAEHARYRTNAIVSGAESILHYEGPISDSADSVGQVHYRAEVLDEAAVVFRRALQFVRYQQHRYRFLRLFGSRRRRTWRMRNSVRLLHPAAMAGEAQVLS